KRSINTNRFRNFALFGSRVGDRCSRHYDCTSPFSACMNSQCVCISGTIQQGSRCVAAANCPLGGLPGQRCVIKTEPALAFNLPSDQDDCPPGQYCVAAADSPVGHCCPVVCPLASHVDTQYSCDPNATQPLKCPSDTHFCHYLSGVPSLTSMICTPPQSMLMEQFSDGLVSQAVCCRRPCNALAPNALYANNQGQCQCLSGFHPSVDTLTHPAKNPSQTCSRDCESEALSKDTSCMKACFVS
ncbi:hypothetical protein ANCDUO_11222, partial [Ancylostoma duodenale]